MRRIAFIIAIAAVLGPLGAGTGQAQDKKEDRSLTVVQDESSMELLIEHYLKANHQLVINEKHNGDDLWLEVPMKGDPMPAYRYSIDTQPANTDDSKHVTERAVRIQLFTGMKVPDSQRDPVLRVINDFNRRKIFSAVYVDTDNEIIIDWTLNVLSVGLDAEYVYDAVSRMDKLWRELYPLVSPHLQ